MKKAAAAPKARPPKTSTSPAKTRSAKPTKSSTKRSAAKSNRSSTKPTTSKPKSSQRKDPTDKVSLSGESRQERGLGRANKLSKALEKAFGPEALEQAKTREAAFEKRVKQDFDSVTVEKGDTLSGIAGSSLQATGLKNPTSSETRAAVKEFVEANPSITDANKIRAGSKLNVPRRIADDRRLNEFGQAVLARTTGQSSEMLYDQVGLARLLRDNPAEGQTPGQESVSPVGERFNKLMVRNGMPNIQTRAATTLFDEDGNLDDFTFGAMNTDNGQQRSFSGTLKQNE